MDEPVKPAHDHGRVHFYFIDAPALNGPIPQPPCRFLFGLFARDADILQQVLVEIEQTLALAPLLPHAGNRGG